MAVKFIFVASEVCFPPDVMGNAVRKTAPRLVSHNRQGRDAMPSDVPAWPISIVLLRLAVQWGRVRLSGSLTVRAGWERKQDIRGNV